MKLLYSNILPLRTEEDQETIMDCFTEQMKSQLDILLMHHLLNWTGLWMNVIFLKCV